MGMFAGMKDTKSAQGRGVYPKAGNYVVQLRRCLEKKRQKDSQEIFLVEYTVLESQQTDGEPNGINSEPVWIVKMPGSHNLGLSNVKNFLVAAYGSYATQNGEPVPDETDIGEVEADAAVGDESLMPGLFLTVKAVQIETQAGGEFTVLDWGIPENVKELAAAAVAA